MTRRWVVTLLSTMTLLLLLAPPASATATGQVDFECEVYLPAWPAAAATGTCGSGTLDSHAVVELSGIDNDGGPYSVAGAGSVGAQFEYNNSCLTNEPIFIFSARGVMTVTGVPAVHRGVTTSATVAFPFAWTGFGSALIITAGNPTIAFDNGGTASGSVAGAGAGATLLSMGITNVCPTGGPATGIGTGTIFWPA